MALNKPNTQTTAQFESFEDTDMTAQETTTIDDTAAEIPATTQAAQTATAVQVAQPTTQAAQTAVQVAQPSALAIARPKGQLATALASSNLFENELREAMAVTWEDFNSINAHSGRFQVKTGAGDPTKLSTELTLKLVSFQDQFVSAAKDTEAQGDNMVKYSDDGKVLNDGSGMTVAEHQQYLKDQGEDPTLSHRMVVVGELLDGGEKAMELGMTGMLVQVVLADTARRNFLSHGKQLAYQIANGRMSQDDAIHVKLVAQEAGSGKKQFTLVTTTFADGKGPKAR